MRLLLRILLRQPCARRAARSLRVGATAGRRASSQPYRIDDRRRATSSPRSMVERVAPRHDARPGARPAGLAAARRACSTPDRWDYVFTDPPPGRRAAVAQGGRAASRAKRWRASIPAGPSRRARVRSPRSTPARLGNRIRRSQLTEEQHRRRLPEPRRQPPPANRAPPAPQRSLPAARAAPMAGHVPARQRVAIAGASGRMGRMLIETIYRVPR